MRRSVQSGHTSCPFTFAEVAQALARTRRAGGIPAHRPRLPCGAPYWGLVCVLPGNNAVLWSRGVSPTRGFAHGTSSVRASRFGGHWGPLSPVCPASLACSRNHATATRCVATVSGQQTRHDDKPTRGLHTGQRRMRREGGGRRQPRRHGRRRRRSARRAWAGGPAAAAGPAPGGGRRAPHESDEQIRFLGTLI